MSEQRTPEWFAARLGKATASRIADVIAKTRSGWGASRDDYATELVLERLNGKPIVSFVSDAMKKGIEREPIARAAYEFHAGCEVQEVGFIQHPEIPMVGASPDGLVGEDGQLEIKCPLEKKHLKTLLSGTIDGDYITQMQFQMACTGRQWCDFVSFHDEFPEALKLFVKRVQRDDNLIAWLVKEVLVFLNEVDQKVVALNALTARAKAAA